MEAESKERMGFYTQYMTDAEKEGNEIYHSNYSIAHHTLQHWHNPHQK